MVIRFLLIIVALLSFIPGLTLGEHAMLLDSYVNARTILLQYNEERALECSVGGAGYPFLHPITWYFGKTTKTLKRINFNSSGHFVSLSDGSEFRQFKSFRLSVRASGFCKNESWLDSFKLRLNRIGPNGVLACATPTASAKFPEPLGQPRAGVVFHLMVLLPPRTAEASSGPTRCPLPGYRLGSYAGRAACHPCLPGEFGRETVCLPCRPGFESHGFASARCLPAAAPAGQLRRHRRSAAAPSADAEAGQISRKRLPLANFSTIVMYHFILVLLLSFIGFLYLLVAAYSFETVWNGVLSEKEMTVANSLAERFVVEHPDPDPDVEDSE